MVCSAYCVQNHNCCHDEGLEHAQQLHAPHKDLCRLVHKQHRLHHAHHQTQQSHTWRREETTPESNMSPITSESPLAVGTVLKLRECRRCVFQKMDVGPKNLAC